MFLTALIMAVKKKKRNNQNVQEHVLGLMNLDIHSFGIFRVKFCLHNRSILTTDVCSSGASKPFVLWHPHHHPIQELGHLYKVKPKPLNSCSSALPSPWQLPLHSPQSWAVREPCKLNHTASDIPYLTDFTGFVFEVHLCRGICQNLAFGFYT